MTRPLQITTTTHAFALAVYFGAFGQGLSFLFGWSDTRGVWLVLRTEGMVAIWAFWWLIGAAMGAFGALVAPRHNDPVRQLEREAFGALILATTNAIYFVGLIARTMHPIPAQSPMFPFTTSIYALVFCLGGVARVLQIVRERKQLRLARNAPREADPPLAEPLQTE